MGCAFAAAAPASHATHYRINALVKHSRQPLRRAAMTSAFKNTHSGGTSRELDVDLPAPLGPASNIAIGDPSCSATASGPSFDMASSPDRRTRCRAPLPVAGPGNGDRATQPPDGPPTR
jgi:hypothetical protein